MLSNYNLNFLAEPVFSNPVDVFNIINIHVYFYKKGRKLYYIFSYAFNNNILLKSQLSIAS